MDGPPLRLTKTDQPAGRSAKDLRLFNYMALAVYALMAQVATSLYYRATVDQSTSKLYDLAQFTAWRPYQYRVLIPSIVHLLARPLHANPDQYQVLYSYIEAACFFGALVAFRAYLCEFVPAVGATAMSFLLFVPMLMIHVSCAVYRLPSDTPQIMLFTLGLIALRRQSWPWLYAALLVATFNRESSALLILAFAAVMLGQMPWKRYAAHLAGLCAVFGGVKLFVDHLFARNPGGMTENHMLYNSGLVTKLIHGDPSVLGTTILLSTIPAILYTGRRHIPGFLLRLLVLAPCFIAIMFRVGVLDEVRAYNEMIPIIAAPMLVLFYRLGERAARMDARTDDPLDESGHPDRNRQQIAA